MTDAPTPTTTPRPQRWRYMITDDGAHYWRLRLPDIDTTCHVQRAPEHNGDRRPYRALIHFRGATYAAPERFSSARAAKLYARAHAYLLGALAGKVPP